MLLFRYLVGLTLFSILGACSSGGSSAQDAVGHDSFDGAADLDVMEVSKVDAPIPPEGARRDLLPYLRIRTSEPVGIGPLPWPQESRDGGGAIRDGHPDTGFLPPSGESWVELDLGPLTGKSLFLDSLELGFQEKAPVKVTVELSQGCGGPATEVFDYPLGGASLSLTGKRALCVLIRMETEGDCRLNKVVLTTRDEGVALPVIDDLPIPTPSSLHPGSGVVEGFYGVPWSFKERYQMLHLLSAIGVDSYIYAPKNDDLHRGRWREPYPEDTMAGFARLAEVADRFSVKFYFGISPFVDYDESGDDYSILREKLLRFVDLGVQGVVLLADDIEFEGIGAIDGQLGAMHVATVNAILNDLRQANPELEVWFCPTVYSDDRLTRWDGGADYLAHMNDLYPDVKVLWTGMDTFNEFLTGSDFDTVHGIIGRPTVLWDNYYANDGGDGFIGRILLGVYEGRTGDLTEVLDGIVNNPSIQGGLTRLAIATSGTWFEHPDSTSRQEQVEDALALEAPRFLGVGTDPALPLELLMDTFNSKTLGVSGHREFESLIDTLETRLEAAPLDIESVLSNMGELASLAARLNVLYTTLYHSRVDPEMMDEVVYPLRKVRFESEVVLYALLGLTERLAGRPGTAFFDEADGATQRSSECRFQFSTEYSERLINACKGRPPVDRGVELVPAVPIPQTPISTAQEWVYKPFPVPCSSLQVFGLPGAALDDEGEIRWTPPYPGRFSGSVICQNNSAPEPSLGWTRFDLIVLP